MYDFYTFCFIVVETSRTKLDNNNEKENPQPVRKVIKPDFNLLLDSFEVCFNTTLIVFYFLIDLLIAEDRS